MENQPKTQIRLSVDKKFRGQMKIFAIDNQIDLEEFTIQCLQKGFEVIKNNNSKIDAGDKEVNSN